MVKLNDCNPADSYTSKSSVIELSIMPIAFVRQAFK
jgi:hypothetical protein